MDVPDMPMIRTPEPLYPPLTADERALQAEADQHHALREEEDFNAWWAVRCLTCLKDIPDMMYCTMETHIEGIARDAFHAGRSS
jgi:hypothetical protein